MEQDRSRKWTALRICYESVLVNGVIAFSRVFVVDHDTIVVLNARYETCVKLDDFVLNTCVCVLLCLHTWGVNMHVLANADGGACTGAAPASVPCSL